jgi:hypothetical protein
MTPPRSVLKAKFSGDTKRLSELGKIGAKRKKERAEALKEVNLRLHLKCAEQMAKEANEDIAPLT